MSSKDFDAFKSNFTGDIVTPSDPGYELAIKRWASNASRPAKVVAFVANQLDVSAAISYARAQNLPIAVRGGGHSVSGTSSQKDGLVIDLSRYLNKARVDPEKKLAYVEGGAIWETVDKVAIEHGLASVAGTVNHTGVGGLTLGGGYGWLSAKHGLVIDSLIQVTIVLANGSALTANKDENTDLFWAVRGGGVFAGPLIFPGPLIGEVFKVAKQKWEKGMTENEGVYLVTTRGPPPERHPCVLACLFYNGPESQARQSVFKEFYDIGPIQDHSGEIPYEKLNSQFNAIAFHGQGAYLRGALQSTVHADRAMDLLNTVAKLSDSEIDGSAFRVSVIIEMLPLEKVASIASNADMAFNGRSRRLNALINVFWDENTPENEVKGAAKAKEITDLLKSFEADAYTSHAYGNYMHGVDASGGGAAFLFGENYPKLQRIKARYDSDNIFNKWFPITPFSEAAV